MFIDHLFVQLKILHTSELLNDASEIERKETSSVKFLDNQFFKRNSCFQRRKIKNHFTDQ